MDVGVFQRGVMRIRVQGKSGVPRNLSRASISVARTHTVPHRLCKLSHLPMRVEVKLSFNRCIGTTRWPLRASKMQTTAIVDIFLGLLLPAAIYTGMVSNCLVHIQRITCSDGHIT